MPATTTRYKPHSVINTADIGPIGQGDDWLKDLLKKLVMAKMAGPPEKPVTMGAGTTRGTPPLAALRHTSPAMGNAYGNMGGYMRPLFMGGGQGLALGGGVGPYTIDEPNAPPEFLARYGDDYGLNWDFRKRG